MTSAGDLSANIHGELNARAITLATWQAVRGDGALKIQRRAGHTDFKTTSGYIATAEAVREGFGEPFPVLRS